MQTHEFELATKHFHGLTQATALLERFLKELGQRAKVALEQALVADNEPLVNVKIKRTAGAYQLFFAPDCWSQNSSLSLVVDQSDEGANACFWVECYGPVCGRSEGEALVELFCSASATTDYWYLDTEEVDAVTWEMQEDGQGEFGVSVWPVTCTDVDSALKALVRVACWHHEHVEKSGRDSL